jgi:hypothetical protein
MAIIQFLEGATLLKKAKYLPEREVRIVAIPGAPGYQKQAKIERQSTALADEQASWARP